METQSASGKASFSLRGALDIVATLAIIAAAGTMIWSNRSVAAPSDAGKRTQPAIPTEPVSIEGAPSVGDPNAKVVVIEFSDFECPYCGKFARETFPVLKTKYIDTRQVQFFFRHLPLPQIHPHARAAAEAAACAAQQDRFWAYHDALFSGPGTLDSERLSELSSLVVRGPFDDCMRLGSGTQRVADDVATAGKLSLRGTPSFLFAVDRRNDKVTVRDLIAGFATLEEFARRIDALSN